MLHNILASITSRNSQYALEYVKSNNQFYQIQINFKTTETVMRMAKMPALLSRSDCVQYIAGQWC